MKKRNFETMVAAIQKAGIPISYFGDDQKVYIGTGSGRSFNPIAHGSDFRTLVEYASQYCGDKLKGLGGLHGKDTQSRIRFMEAYTAGAFDKPRWATGGAVPPKGCGLMGEQLRCEMPPERPASIGIDYKTNPYELEPGSYHAQMLSVDYSEVENRIVAQLVNVRNHEEKETENMSISNKELNGMINLMHGAMTLVVVRFKEKYGNGLSRKQYTYKFDGKNVEVGDNVVVDSPSKGYVTAVVEEVLFNQVLGIDDEYTYKWVVCKVTDRAYKARCEREQAVKEMIKEDFNRMRGQKALNHLRTVLGDSVDIDTYTDILKNKKNV